MVEMGKLKKVPLTEVWPHEAQDFTPWLAGNLDKLGQAVGLDLELLSSESAVGVFSLDILAQETGSHRPVVIENQLGKTDHGHLGQLLTYAAGNDANVVVWLTGDFRDEHRAALDWLNQKTDEDTQFFGVVVEAWRIDGSNPAPHFKLVAMPNDWQKQSAAKAKNSQSGEVWERGERYREFFQPLVDVCREQHQLTNTKVAQAKSWQSYKTGFSEFGYGTSFGKGFARVELYIDCGDRDLNKSRFDELVTMKGDIIAELGNDLDWQRLDHARACRISAVRSNSTVDDSPQELVATRNWMEQYLLKFRDVFGPRLAELVE